MNDNLWVTFKVEISDEQYAYCSDKRGESEIQIQVPREALTCINPGNLFIATLNAALVNFDRPKEDNDAEDGM